MPCNPPCAALDSLGRGVSGWAGLVLFAVRKWPKWPDDASRNSPRGCGVVQLRQRGWASRSSLITDNRAARLPSRGGDKYPGRVGVWRLRCPQARQGVVHQLKNWGREGSHFGLRLQHHLPGLPAPTVGQAAIRARTTRGSLGVDRRNPQGLNNPSSPHDPFRQQAFDICKTPPSSSAKPKCPAPIYPLICAPPPSAGSCTAAEIACPPFFHFFFSLPLPRIPETLGHRGPGPRTRFHLSPFSLQFAPLPRGLGPSATRSPHRLDCRFRDLTITRHSKHRSRTRDHETGVGALQDTQDLRAALADLVNSRAAPAPYLNPHHRNIDSATTQSRPRISRGILARPHLFNPRPQSRK